MAGAGFYSEEATFRVADGPTEDDGLGARSRVAAAGVVGNITEARARPWGDDVGDVRSRRAGVRYGTTFGSVPRRKTG